MKEMTPEARRRAVVRLRRLGAAGAATTVLALPLLIAGPARAQARPSAGLSAAGTTATTVPSSAPTLGGWNASADGNAVDILFDNATGLAGIHPFTDADFPEAQSQFQTGPFGAGLATVFWPGAAGGNFGSLSTELGLPAQLEPIATQLNDPIKASAQYPSGPASARYPTGSSGGAAVMTSTAGAGGTTAEGAITDESPSTVLSFSEAEGSSSTTASSTVQSQSTSDLSGVSILGGLVDIGSISSTASASSNGTTGTGKAVTHVGGVTVAGQNASIGSDGLVLPSKLSGVNAITGTLVKNALQQVISGLGLTVTEFPATEKADGASYVATSGGVSVKIDPPSSLAPLLEQATSVIAPYFPTQAAIIPTLPGLLQGGTLTITLGRATASADASTAYVSTFTPPASIPFSSATIAPSTASSGGGTIGTGSVGGGSVPVSSGSTGGAAPSISGTGSSSPSSGTNGTGGSVSSPPTALVSLSKPLEASALVLGILATLIAAGGLWAVSRMLLPRDTDPVCPLGQDS